MALTLLVEPRQGSLDLAVRHRDDVGLGSATALEGALVAAFIRVWVFWVEVWLIATKICTIYMY